MAKTRNSNIQFNPTPAGKHVIPTRVEELSTLENQVLKDLDPDKLSDLAEVLYAFNNYKVGPMDGLFMAVEVISGAKWCVGQLCADRAKPLKLYEDQMFSSAKKAQQAAKKMRDTITKKPR